jgi:hypothetical protein
LIRAVYILIEGGVCIYSRVYDTANVDPFLISSFISAVASFSQEAIGNELRGIESEGKFIFIADHNQIITAIIADDPNEISPQISETIALKFLSEYAPHIQSGIDDADVFQSFDNILDKIIPPHLALAGRIEPREPLDALEIIKIPPYLRKLALLILREKEVTVHQVAHELSLEEEVATSWMEELVALGKVGRRDTMKGLIYFL